MRYGCTCIWRIYLMNHYATHLMSANMQLFSLRVKAKYWHSASLQYWWSLCSSLISLINILCLFAANIAKQCCNVRDAVCTGDIWSTGNSTPCFKQQVSFHHIWVVCVKFLSLNKLIFCLLVKFIKHNQNYYLKLEVLTSVRGLVRRSWYSVFQFLTWRDDAMSRKRSYAWLSW